MRRACATGEGGSADEALAGLLVRSFRATERWDTAKTFSKQCKARKATVLKAVIFAHQTSLPKACLTACYLKILASSNCRKHSVHPQVRLGPRHRLNFRIFSRTLHRLHDSQTMSPYQIKWPEKLQAADRKHQEHHKERIAMESPPKDQRASSAMRFGSPSSTLRARYRNCQPQSVPPIQHHASGHHKPAVYRDLYHLLHEWSRRLCFASHYGLLEPYG